MQASWSIVGILLPLLMSPASAQQKTVQPKLELKTYFTIFELAVCGKTARLLEEEEMQPAGAKKLGENGCFVLPKNEPVLWDGKTAQATEASVSVREKTVFISRAFLDDHKHQDIFNIKFATSSIAVLCGSPFNLTEAVRALRDEKWLNSLDCAKAPAGLEVIKIRPETTSLTEPWQVRVKRPDGEGITVWGYPFAFTLPNGEQIR